MKNTFCNFNMADISPIYKLSVQKAATLVGAKTGVASQIAANGFIYQNLMKQSALFSFTDGFYISAIMMLCIVPFVFLLKSKHGNATITVH